MRLRFARLTETAAAQIDRLEAILPGHGREICRLHAAKLALNEVAVCAAPLQACGHPLAEIALALSGLRLLRQLAKYVGEVGYSRRGL